MGTHPIFESDFDCLTEREFDSGEKENMPSSREMSRSKSRSNSRSRRRKRSESSNDSPRRRKRSKSNSRSRSRSARRSRDRSGSRDRRRHKSRSVSPTKYKKQRHFGDREDPSRSRCLGVFNLGRRTTEDEFRRIFERYGKLEKCSLVYDQKRDESRGFGFITYEDIETPSLATSAGTLMERMECGVTP